GKPDFCAGRLRVSLERGPVVLFSLRSIASLKKSVSEISIRPGILRLGLDGIFQHSNSHRGLAIAKQEHPKVQVRLVKARLERQRPAEFGDCFVFFLLLAVRQSEDDM